MTRTSLSLVAFGAFVLSTPAFALNPQPEPPNKNVNPAIAGAHPPSGHTMVPPVTPHAMGAGSAHASMVMDDYCGTPPGKGPHRMGATMDKQSGLPAGKANCKAKTAPAAQGAVQAQ